MTVGVKHTGRRKSVNPNFPYMRFAIWMCDYCDEPLSGQFGMLTDKDGKNSKSYHLVCLKAVLEEQT